VQRLGVMCHRGHWVRSLLASGKASKLMVS
jgi:hypothetical protein